MQRKNNLIPTSVILASVFGVIILFLIAVIVMTKVGVQEKVSTSVSPTSQTGEMMTMNIVSFNQTNEGPVHYKGAAMTCNELGGCDSINFISDKKPEIGPATFVRWYNSDGSIGGWLFVEMSLVL